MSFFTCTTRPKKKYHKFALVEIFRQPSKQSSPNNLQIKIKQEQEEKLNKFITQLAEDKVDYERIQTLSWNGIPHCLRPKIWKCLLRYSLFHSTEETLLKKRNEYQTYVKNYWKEPTQLNQSQRKIYQTIDCDVKRIGAEFNSAFKEECLQNLLKRMLYVWHMRHPASGYVQGMCDLVNPFLIVFLSEYLPVDEQEGKFLAPLSILSQNTLGVIQADIYFCMSKMLEYVTKNYTSGFNGLHQSYNKVQELLYAIDEQLYQHLAKYKIDLFSFAFRNISTMLLRMFNPLVGVRLFDSYISYQTQYPKLMIYLLIVILEKYANKILAIKGDELMTYMQKLPTKQWGIKDLELSLAEAFALRKIYGEKE